MMCKVFLRAVENDCITKNILAQKEGAFIVY